MPHVHFHLLPRKLRGDRFAGRSDDVYPALERAEASLPRDVRLAHQDAGSGEGLVPGGEPIKMDADEDRKPRTVEEMVVEAEWLSGFFDDAERDAPSG